MSRLDGGHSFDGQDLDALNVALRTAFSANAIRPFLVTAVALNRRQIAVNVHLAKDAVRQHGRAAAAWSRMLPRDLSHLQSKRLAIRVSVHSASALERPRSLEAFVARFVRGRLLYDPTGAFGGADRLVALAAALRFQLRDELKGLHWSSRMRTLYVLLHEGIYSDSFGMMRDKLIAAEQAVDRGLAASAEGAQAHDTIKSVKPSIRLCFQLPAIPLVRVDAASDTEGTERLGRPYRSRLKKLAALARVPLLSGLLGMGSAAAEAGLPADSQIETDNSAILTIRPTPSADTGSRSTSDLPEARQGRKLRDGVPGHEVSSFWRDPFAEAIDSHVRFDKAQIAPGPLGNSVAGDQYISRQHFAAAALSGVTFGAVVTSADEGSRDVAWHVEAQPGAPGELRQQPGVAALAGLSSLSGPDSSAIAYDAVLEHLQAHLGLPSSLRDDVLEYFGGPAEVSGSALHSGQRTIKIAQSQSYWEWLKHQRRGLVLAADNSSSSDDEESDEDKDPDGEMQSSSY